MRSGAFFGRLGGGPMPAGLRSSWVSCCSPLRVSLLFLTPAAPKWGRLVLPVLFSVACREIRRVGGCCPGAVFARWTRRITNAARAYRWPWCRSGHHRVRVERQRRGVDGKHGRIGNGERIGLAVDDDEHASGFDLGFEPPPHRTGLGSPCKHAYPAAYRRTD